MREQKQTQNTKGRICNCLQTHLGVSLSSGIYLCLQSPPLTQNEIPVLALESSKHISSDGYSHSYPA